MLFVRAMQRCRLVRCLDRSYGAIQGGWPRYGLSSRLIPICSSFAFSLRSFGESGFVHGTAN